jgi:Serine hydrolase (FSH1)
MQAFTSAWLAAGGAKMKIVCLHGYMQNGAILRHKMGSWRKGLKSRLEFEFVDAPIKVTESDHPQLAERLEARDDTAATPDYRSWCAVAHARRAWPLVRANYALALGCGGALVRCTCSPACCRTELMHGKACPSSNAVVDYIGSDIAEEVWPQPVSVLQPVRPQTSPLSKRMRALCRWHFTAPTRGARPGTREPVVISGWPAARQVIADALAAAGPGAALMGFSQGATAAAAYAAAAAADAVLPAPRCVIAVAGFMPRDKQLCAEVAGGGIWASALHVIGASDQIIPRDRSDELAAACRGDVRVHVHTGGHLVPTCTGALKQDLVAFLDGVAARAADAPRGAVATSAL